jgi:hypothetical protein
MNFTAELPCHVAPDSLAVQPDPITVKMGPISGSFTNYSQSQNETSRTTNKIMTHILSGRTTQQAAKLIYQVLARHILKLQSATHQCAPGFMTPNTDVTLPPIFKLIQK